MRRVSFSCTQHLVLTLLLMLSSDLFLPGATRAADVEYVIHVSVDGLRGDLLRAMLEGGAEDLPAFRRFRAEGATTCNARTDYGHTNTLPNHTCMLTGRPVDRPPGWPSTAHHGYVWNKTPRRGETLHGRGNPDAVYVAGVFDVVHDAGFRTALYVSKRKFLLYDRSWNEKNGAPDTTGADDGRDKIDRYVDAASGSPDNAAALNDSLLADLRSNPARYSFVHYVDPDAGGHDSGWGNSGWKDSIRAVDGYLGRVLDCIVEEPRLAGRTVVLVSADHGGVDGNHGDPEKVEDYTIPFLVWGAGVARGADLYELNRGRRRDPGTARPAYTDAVQPIRNGDGANLALSLLGLPPVPGSSINARQDLAVAPVAGRAGSNPAHE